MDTLEAWIAQQYAHSAQAMMRSVSPVGLVKARPMFAQRICPKPGSIIASPVLGAYDPEPDYFFHWHRDAAIVLDALRCLHIGGRVELDATLADYVRFNLALATLDGNAPGVLPEPEQVAPEYRRYVRPAAELKNVRGAEAVALDTRVNPDGTLDILCWSRPQYDGPALRVMSLLRWDALEGLDPVTRAGLESLVRSDLATLHRWAGRPCYDLWEEEEALHYYTLRVAAAALSQGAAWLERRAACAEAALYREQAAAVLESLDGFWDDAGGLYRSRLGGSAQKIPDIAVILAVIHAAARSGAHSVTDPRIHRTLEVLERLFGALYPINQGLAPDRAPALGRYPGDRYYAGGAYYFSTLGAAELCFRAAQALADARAWITRGNHYLRTVRDHTPTSGDMSEQFDQRSGEPASARQLAWSYAAFITCTAARAEAYAALQ